KSSARGSDCLTRSCCRAAGSESSTRRTEGPVRDTSAAQQNSLSFGERGGSDGDAEALVAVYHRRGRTLSLPRCIGSRRAGTLNLRAAGRAAGATAPLRVPKAAGHGRAWPRSLVGPVHPARSHSGGHAAANPRRVGAGVGATATGSAVVPGRLGGRRRVA